MKIIIIHKPSVITNVEILVNRNFQLVDAENPINPKIKVINDMANTTFNGCVCNKLVNVSTVSLDDTDIKNSATQIKENINDHKLIFNFIVSPFTIIIG